MRARLPAQVILLGLVSLLNDAASEMIYPLLPIFLTATLGATPLIIGIIEGAADGVASVLRYLAGSWSDRLPRRKPFVVTGYALAAASRALIGVAGSWATVLSARLIDRAGKGLRSAPRDAMIADVAETRGRAFGFHRAMDHTGAVIGPLLAVGLIGLFTLREMFLLAVIPGALGVLLLIFALREPRRQPSALGPRPSADSSLQGRFWHAMAAIALFALANSSDVFLLLQAHAAGVTTAMLPLLWAAHHVVKALFSTQAGALSDRLGRRSLLVAGWLIYAMVYAAFPFARNLTVFVVLFVAYALPFTLTEGAERALVGDLVPAGVRGKGFGVYYLVNGAGVLFGSALFGLIYQEISPRAAFFTGAALAVGAALLMAKGEGRRAKVT